MTTCRDSPPPRHRPSRTPWPPHDGHGGLPALARARIALAAYAHADSSPVAVVLRRPFQRILDDLERAQSGEGVRR